ncbi:hypothetical protein IFM89_025494 [Coptis chinensis]|uniref:DUF4216 domain-containing protein n=1 Tax=Coptis chinensis TaxID=261450 RepID=A0A835I453_9MAGN|nr:hypothetical protein IFM89_025494 [Coptis chinensis]
MNAMTNFRASAKDKKLVSDDTTYYGIIRQILELDYFDFTVTIFCCDWVRVEDKVNRCYTDPDINLTFVNLSKFKGSSKIVDEPFILASQASQVKYSVFLPAVLGFLLSVYSLKSIGSDMLRQESTESSKQVEKRARKTMLSREAVMARDLNGGIHISDSGSSSSDSQVFGGGGSCVSSKGKKKVEFDSDGQPVRDGSEGFSSLLGGTTKTHCQKDFLKEYNVDDAYKKINLKKVAKSFREFKHHLRVKYYDKYDNDVDRKRNCPTGVKLEEWEKFMDNESKPSRKLTRAKGKVAREALKTLHTSSRRGATRTVHDMKSKNPNVKVTRTDSYMAIHTHKDGSFIAPQRMERIKAIIEDDPASVNLDLDHDPVAQVCGPDKFGRVPGMSIGISKTALTSLTPAKEQLGQQKQQHSMLEEWFGSLERQMVTLTKILLETREEVAGQQSHRRIVADSSTMSNARDTTRSQSHGDSSRRMELCEN